MEEGAPGCTGWGWEGFMDLALVWALKNGKNGVMKWGISEVCAPRSDTLSLKRECLESSEPRAHVCLKGVREEGSCLQLRKWHPASLLQANSDPTAVSSSPPDTSSQRHLNSNQCLSIHTSLACP